jgi:hypothetical protein
MHRHVSSSRFQAVRQLRQLRQAREAGMARRGATDAGEDGVDPAFHRAILKIALELKKPNAPSYEAIVQATIGSMRLDAVAFRRYLGENGARNMSLLLATARATGPGQ